MRLEDLKGEHTLSGADYVPSIIEFDWFCERGNDILLCIDGENYLMTEDPDDGYRSYMTELEKTDREIKNKFPEQRVFIMYENGDKDVISVCSMKGDLILRVGTDYTDSYYPFAMFEFHPENMEINQ